MKLIAGLMKYEVREGEQYGKPIKLERATFRSIDCVRCLDKQVFSYVSGINFSIYMLNFNLKCLIYICYACRLVRPD